ncbi:hypothetical protein CANARDRAFT_22719 [[Candida] arabinofermentans NRRL YB-2248]|uniref:Small ribosomal subunit protein bS18m n=1 Tax=[Candida] arabinofermentans NRRL YB-2248 TaxID=983967 RepID=A0A1E4T2G4_9ASCO|nr:hypothetical protein CANARDRAFT_22719 [[Candida] arabinofermentans NRRL YB-2248]
MFASSKISVARILSLRSISSTSKKPQGFADLSSSFKKLKEQETAINEVHNDSVSRNFVNSMDGQVTYDPFDFTLQKIKYNAKIDKNVNERLMKSSSFNAPEINPLDFYCLPHMLSKYLSPSGQILHRSVTGLSPRKHKLMAKAVKRARAAGFLGAVSQDITFAPKRGSSL